jgi:polar amino acid transport system substrate-binding protein
MTRVSLHYLCILCVSFFTCAAFSAQLRDKPIAYNSYPPISFINEAEQEIDGPVAELVKAINRKLQQKIEFQFNPLPRMFVELDAHRADAAFNMSYNAERAQKWHYSLPVHVVNYGVFVKESNPLEYKSRKQLEGLTIATYGPTNMSKKVEKFASTLSGTKVIVENDFEHVFKMLTANRFGDKGVVYVPDVVGFDTIKEFDLKNVRYAGADIKNLYYVIFVKETVSKEYVDAFNKVLLEFHQDGTMKKIYDRYKDTTTSTVPAQEDMHIPSQ